MLLLKGTGHEGDQAVGGVVAKEELVVPVGFGGKLRASGKEGVLVLRKCSFDVVGMCGDGFAKFGTVIHGEVGTLAMYDGDIRWAASPRRVTPATRSHRWPIGRA